ncbi:MAG: hypothetical protein R3E48_21910 [Burkholderiaceae bacterium]
MKLPEWLPHQAVQRGLFRSVALVVQRHAIGGARRGMIHHRTVWAGFLAREACKVRTSHGVSVGTVAPSTT